MQPTSTDLVHPAPEPPAPGEAIEIAPGILWMRLPLPFRLDHVNIYAIEDGGGWAVIDAGIGDDATKAAWERLIAGPLAGRPITRLVITHMHPDHVGAAGWLAGRTGLPLEMTETEYLQAALLLHDPGALAGESYRHFYLDNGLDPAIAETVMTRGHDYLRMLTGLPPTFRRVIAGERLRIGGRDFQVMTGGGHASEQIMLFCASDNLFLSADQVMARISPNVSVHARDPEGDPLGIFLRSLRSLKAAVPEDALVLPGHNMPFVGLWQRVDELAAHHEERCVMIIESCRERARSAAALVPVVFHRPLDAHQTSFAFSEILAHVNYLLRRGRLARVESADRVHRFAAAG